MFEGFKNYIVDKLYEKIIQQSSKDMEQNRRDAQNYYNITKENITAIVANALSILAFGDGSVSVGLERGTTKRTEYLNEIAQREFTRAKRKTSSALGVGMIASIPYCTDNGLGRKVYIDTITKDRFFITGVQGDEITEITALADEVAIGNDKYRRWTDYSIKNGVYTIRNKATNYSGREIPLSQVKKWENIQPEISIAGADRLPIAFYSCPSGGRRPDSITGVPITYGCNSTLDKIATTLKDIEREFKSKKVKLHVPNQMLLPQRDENGKVVGKTFDEDLYVRLADSDKEEVLVFDPAIRESSYFSKLTQHFAMLEKEIGCSRGILTDMTTQGATATEIRRSMNATFCLTDDMRKEYTKYFDNLMYAVNLLCNYYNLTPISDYTVKFDWSYSLLEDSEQTFRQLLEGKSQGAVSTLELRQFLKPGESPEDAQAVIDEIKKTEPTMTDLMGLGDDAPPPEPKKEIEAEIDDTITKQLNGAQTQSLINIVMQFRQGVLTEGQAINIISTSIGISKEQATELLRA